MIFQIILTELLSGGELFEKVAADNFELTEAEVVVFMREITEGARYIHQQVLSNIFYDNLHRFINVFIVELV